MRLVTARCSALYDGRGQTYLPSAVRLVMIKRDGSVAIHSDDRSYKPQNWMLPPCLLTVQDPGPDAPEGCTQVWVVASKKETLTIYVERVLSDTEHALAEADPGLDRSWTEAHLQQWISTHLDVVFGEPGWTLVGREYPTGAGPVDLLVRDPSGAPVAVEVKRTAMMPAVDQAGRYAQALAGSGDFPQVRAMVVALDVRPRTRELADQRGVGWLEIPQGAFRGAKGGPAPMGEA